MTDETTGQPDQGRDDEIERAWVDRPPDYNATITLADYDPDWPICYQRLATIVRAALGDRVLLLEHVGSTAVPGLVAKPKIDIVLAVTDTDAEDDYVPALERAGFALVVREPEWFEHRLLTRQDIEVNLHVFPASCPEIGEMLAFRDWLRNHDDDRDRYARTKRELAAREWRYVQHYADAKAVVVGEIKERAARTVEPE